VSIRRLAFIDPFRESFSFGRRSLAAVLYENIWFYVGVLALGVALTTWATSYGKFQTISVEWIAAIGSLGAAARYALPSFRMTPRAVWSVFVIDLAGPAIGVLLVGGPIALMLLTRVWIIGLVLFVTGPVGIWAAAKLACAPAFYALHRDEKGSIFEALRESWYFVSDENWMRAFGLEFCIGLVAAAGPAIVAMIVYLNVAKSQPFVAVIVAATIYYAGSIPAAVWAQISLLAFATSKDGVALEGAS